MKGIRKLFLGLIFTTLFCAGFRIEAKAALPTLKPYLDVCEKKTNGYDSTDFGNDNAKLIGYVKIGEYDFPDINPDSYDETGTVTFIFEGKVLNTSVTSPSSIAPDPCKVELISVRRLWKDGDPGYDPDYDDYVVDNIIKINGTEVTENATGIYTIFDDIGRDTVRNDLGQQGGSTVNSITGNYKLVLTGSVDNPDFSDTEIDNLDDVKGIDYDSAAKSLTVYRVYGGAYVGNSTDKAEAKVIYDDDKAKVLDETGIYMFPKEVKTFSTDIPESSSPNPSYTFMKSWMANTTAKSGETYKLTMANEAVNLKALFGKLDLNITQTTTKLKPGDTSNESYEFKGYNPASSSAVDAVYVDDTKLTGSDLSWSGSKLKFKVPDGATEGTHTLKIVMNSANGGGEHIRKFSVDNGEDISLNSPLYVTFKMTIPVNKFITPESSTKVATAELSGDAASYSRLKKTKTGSNVTKVEGEGVDNIYLYGAAETGSDSKKQFKLTYNSKSQLANVMVFPWPDLVLTNSSSGDSSLNSSGSSSSSSSANSPFKVVMPAGDYHDGITWGDIKKAKLVFKTSDKSKEATLDINETGKYTRTATVNSMAVTSILNDICSDSSQDVDITVYPMNSGDTDTAIYDKETITAYKITLDGSGGAKYTVNGTEMKDYFYAVKGTTYSIKSTSGNGEKFTKWDGDDFSSENGGTFTASGAKTFKAIYGGSSSSSSTGRNSGAAGDNLDDYDDVPKTGESKADIWILWSVLLISILGAGFMIYKRFGLVRAIAQADEEAAIAERIERAEAEKKEEENKLNMLKGLRNLK